MSRPGPAGVDAQAGWTPLAWDSSFFGRAIGRVTARQPTTADLARAVGDATGAGVECLYFLADASDQASVRAAEDNGFSLVDIRLTLERPAGTEPGIDPPRGPGEAIRPARADDVPQLMAIARLSHRNTRFHQDARFDPGRSDELYAVWIERSVAGDLADIVWVADVAGAPRGYLTVTVAGGVATIGLVAVHPDDRGRGYGDQLLRAALAWASGRTPRVSVVTQGRDPGAVRFYQRAGFLASAIELWYHRWLTLADAPPADGRRAPAPRAAR